MSNAMFKAIYTFALKKNEITQPKLHARMYI